MHLPGMRTYTILHAREHRQLYQIFPIMAVAIYGENIALNSAGSAYRIHMQWFYSTGHHNNYMLSSYVKGACAIYVYQGVWYAVENFALEESENSGGTLSCNAYGPEAEAALNEYIDSHDW